MRQVETLRMYDTVKTCGSNFFKFTELCIVGKYVKIRFKNRGHHAIFSVLEVKKSKILKILNKRDCFCIHTWFRFYGVSLEKTDLNK